LSRNAQLDIANQLAEMGKFPEAAEAYELFLRHYPDSDQHPHIELLAGLLYARYLNDPVKAAARIEHAMPRLTSARDVELAKAELARLKATPAR
jgi:outer membrane protein assembly factor BamD (BamD/ComL family)